MFDHLVEVHGGELLCHSCSTILYCLFEEPVELLNLDVVHVDWDVVAPCISMLPLEELQWLVDILVDFQNDHFVNFTLVELVFVSYLKLNIDVCSREHMGCSCCQCSNHVGRGDWHTQDKEVVGILGAHMLLTQVVGEQVGRIGQCCDSCHMGPCWHTKLPINAFDVAAHLVVFFHCEWKVEVVLLVLLDLKVLLPVGLVDTHNLFIFDLHCCNQRCLVVDSHVDLLKDLVGVETVLYTCWQ